jgi:hypothetical protein
MWRGVWVLMGGNEMEMSRPMGKGTNGTDAELGWNDQ